MHTYKQPYHIHHYIIYTLIIFTHYTIKLYTTLLYIPLPYAPYTTHMYTGTFGRVKLVVHTPTNTVAAMKFMNKSEVVESHQEKNVLAEKNLLFECSYCTFILQLMQTFNFPNQIVMVMEFVQGGVYMSVYTRVVCMIAVHASICDVYTWCLCVYSITYAICTRITCTQYTLDMCIYRRALVLHIRQAGHNPTL